MKLWLLVGEQLPDAITDRHATVFQLHHCNRQPIEIEHEVWPSIVVTLQRHLLDDDPIICFGIIPGDQLDGFVPVACIRFDRDAVAHSLVNDLVIIVEAARVVVCFTGQNVDGLVDLPRR